LKARVEAFGSPPPHPPLVAAAPPRRPEMEGARAPLEANASSADEAQEGISLGPRMVVFVRTCLEASPRRFIFLWSTACVAMLVTFFIAGRHYWELQKRPASIKRLYYSRIALFAPILGVTATLALFSPHAFYLMKMLQTQVEAVSLSAFGNILFLLVAEESHLLYDGPEHAHESTGYKILMALNREGPKPHFGVPPFACCFRRCLPAHLLRPGHILLARNFVRQYAFMVIMSSMLEMWCALALSAAEMGPMFMITMNLVKLSGFVCIYGLFILYSATHDVLEKFNPTSKFVALKLVVLLMTYQELLVGPIMHFITPASDLCLADPEHSGEEIQTKHREHWTDMYFTALESMLLAFLVRRAFPADELHGGRQEYHMMLVEVDLERVSSAISSEDMEKDSASSSEGDDDDVH